MNDEDLALIMRALFYLLTDLGEGFCPDDLANSLSARADELDARRLAGADAVQVEERDAAPS